MDLKGDLISFGKESAKTGAMGFLVLEIARSISNRVWTYLPSSTKVMGVHVTVIASVAGVSFLYQVIDRFAKAYLPENYANVEKSRFAYVVKVIELGTATVLVVTVAMLITNGFAGLVLANVLRQSIGLAVLTAVSAIPSLILIREKKLRDQRIAEVETKLQGVQDATLMAHVRRFFVEGTLHVNQNNILNLLKLSQEKDIPELAVHCARQIKSLFKLI